MIYIFAYVHANEIRDNNSGTVEKNGEICCIVFKLAVSVKTTRIFQFLLMLIRRKYYGKLYRFILVGLVTDILFYITFSSKFHHNKYWLENCSN